MDVLWLGYSLKNRNISQNDYECVSTIKAIHFKMNESYICKTVQKREEMLNSLKA